MHPDLLRALAHARHEDLLNERRARRERCLSPDHHSPRFTRSRRRLGSLLIWAGARLMGEQRSALELAHE